MFRRFVVSLVLGVAFAVVTVSAQPTPPAKNPNDPNSANAKQLLEKQQQMLRQYKAITEDLLSLAHRYEKSSRVEDQDKAKLIRKAIDTGDQEGVDNKFQALVRTLAGANGIIGLNDVTTAKGQQEELIEALKKMLAILMSDDELLRIREEKNRLEKILAELKGITRETKVQRAITENGKGDPKKIGKDQGNLAKKNDDLANKMEGKEPSKGGPPKDGKGGKGGSGKEGQPKNGEPSNKPPSPQGPKTPGADQVRKAVPDQEEAKRNIDENKRPDAAQKQTEAIQKLEHAQRELEKRLKQLREEELERLLANLEARVAKMLQWQIEVKASTVMIHKIILKNESLKPEKSEIQKSQQLEDKETEIIAEANKTIEILKGEGSSVAFPRVFEETVIDMVRVRERLHLANVGDDTQADEQQIIDTLKEMLEALKKAQQENRQASQGGGGGGPPADQKLLDEIAELKMIRNLQIRVNEKTKRKGDSVKGEQADEPLIKNELRDLSNRQVKIEEMARDLASGKNK